MSTTLVTKVWNDMKILLLFFVNYPFKSYERKIMQNSIMLQK